MHIKQFPLLIALTVFIVAALSCKKEDSSPTILEEECAPVTFSSAALSETYIVILKNETSSPDPVAVERIRQRVNRLFQRHSVRSMQMQSILSTVRSGFIARLSRTEAQRLSQDDQVEVIEQDRVISLEKGCFTVMAPTTAQWGVRRVGVGDGTGKRVWIIDTGIDMDHPDLKVDQALSKSFITNESSPDDDNGHGTHVAGIIGALNNANGVLGVASGATLVALKALDNEGEGNTSGLIRALNYIGQNAAAGDVVNMSLGTDTASNALDYAVRTLADKGILFSVAAGNESKKAVLCSPARVNHQNVYTVSAVDSVGKFANFSNYGNDAVDLAAPGVNIVSTYTKGRFARMSGTSMAAPHVAGLLVLKGRNIRTKGVAINDPDGQPDPIASY